ncbi:MAG: hypothetical protein H6Q89_2805 [Myxococcaceae bacterium]|nr:hypothetical protein [Myxococcaceae bacterium]
MLSVTREKGSGQIVLCSHGMLDDTAVTALIDALALTPEHASVRVDLSRAEVATADCLRRLAIALAKRSGKVKFLGPTWATGGRPAR